MNRKLYMAAYDITHPKRLQQALRILRDYASGGQKSVFECFLTPQERQELYARMQALLDAETDCFILTPLNRQSQVHVLGLGVVPENNDYIYLE